MHVYASSTDELSGDAVLWRYMSFAKFMSMLDSRSLFLSSIASVDDQFEGSLPRGNVLLHRWLREREASADPERESPDIEEFARRRRRSVVVNCWHRSEHESVAMWRLYAGGREGVRRQDDRCGSPWVLPGESADVRTPRPLHRLRRGYCRRDQRLPPLPREEEAFRVRVRGGGRSSSTCP